jgi:hypothetical protein
MSEPWTVDADEDALGWHTISGVHLLDCLRRCEHGEKADLVYAELWANADHEDFTDEMYVWVIFWDQDVFGIFATEQAAREDLARQIAEDGPAWNDCKVEPRKVQR